MKDVADGKRIAKRAIVPLAVLMAILARAPAGARNAAGAQPPERQHDVLIPGTGVRLRESWQMLFHDRCRYAVPVTWRPVPDRSQVFAPDGSSVSIWALHVSNWSLHKARLKSAFSADSHVREDTDSRFWIESHDGVRSQHYVAVTDGTAACAGLLEISTLLPNADDTITAIVESVGMATAWSADLK
jgi:hypothetical protein